MEKNIIVKQDEFETMVALLEDDVLTEVFLNASIAIAWWAMFIRRGLVTFCRECRRRL